MDNRLCEGYGTIVSVISFGVTKLQVRYIAFKLYWNYVILPLYVAVRKDKNTSLGMAMFVFCMAFYNPSMNMMRQSIAMSLSPGISNNIGKMQRKKCVYLCDYCFLIPHKLIADITDLSSV